MGQTKLCFIYLTLIFSYPPVTVHKAFVHLGKHKLCKAFAVFFAPFLFYILKLFPLISTFSSQCYSRFSSETLGIKFYHMNGITVFILEITSF